MKETAERRRLKELYLPPQDRFVVIEVPDMRFLMIDGEGKPGVEAYRAAMQWIFAAVYPIRRIARERMGKNFVEPPLEALYWADCAEDFIAARTDKWKWRVMIIMPEWLDTAMFENAVAQAAKRLGETPASLRVETYHEGKSVQIMHVGPPQEMTAVLTRLHGEFLPANKLTPNGYHHEIYLTDPARVAPEKSKIVLRQPVR